MPLLTPAEYTATAEKIAKLNERSRKRGWTGTVKLTGEEVEVKHYNPMTGQTITLLKVDATIDGEPPKYEGWTFLARAEFDRDSGLVIYGAPGAQPVDRERLVEGQCDHCLQDRYRRKVYIVKHDDGRQLQVGSSCIQDFLGWSINPVFISADMNDYAEDGGWGHFEPTYATEDVLAVAWACIQEFGYVKADDWSHQPTKFAVANVLDPRTAADRKLAAQVRPRIPDAVAQAKRIREWVLSDEFNGPGDYVQNVKNIARGDFVSVKKFGFLVSAPQAWARAQERDLIRRQQKSELLNEWNGQTGDKLELTVTPKSVRHFYNDFGSTTHLYTLEGDDHRIYKWWASNEVWTEFDCKAVKIRGTVKKHDLWNGQKSTVLTRVKVV